MGEETITHVSDTALMAAACRAMETTRAAHGLVCDPFAARLSGARGMAIARALPGMEVMCFGIGIRSRFIDELLLETLAGQSIETVVSIGAGLDTRPWRLQLPAQLRWMEVDFADMLDYKSERMAAEQPACRLERFPADLGDSAARDAVWDAVGPAPALMITEGVLMYLSAASVESLATDAPARSGVHYWLLDLTSPVIEQRTGMQSREAIQQVRAADHLNGLQILDVLRCRGWISSQVRSYVRGEVLALAAARIQELLARRPAGAPMPQPPPDDPSGIHLFANANR